MKGKEVKQLSGLFRRKAIKAGKFKKNKYYYLKNDFVIYYETSS